MMPIRVFITPIPAFTMERSACSRCADPGVQDRPAHALCGADTLYYTQYMPGETALYLAKPL